MALNTPVRFGRALNFGKPNPIPLRKDGLEFPNALGWWSISFQEAATVAEYGPPFLDYVAGIRTGVALRGHIDTDIARQIELLTGLDLEAVVSSTESTVQFITRSGKIVTVIDVDAQFPSIRITRSIH